MPSKKTLQKALEKEREIQELQRQLEEDRRWSEGTDVRGKKRQDKIEKKQEEKLRKAREMKELIDKEEQEYLRNKERPTSRKGKREINALEQELKNRPLTKIESQQREKDARKFEELRRINAREENNRLKKEEEKKKEEELKKKNIVKAPNLFIEINNDNVFEEKSVYDASNIEDAINIFDDDLPDPKVLYKDFYERNLPIVKSELPGLRLSQYQDKIQKMWKISYENPKNVQR